MTIPIRALDRPAVPPEPYQLFVISSLTLAISLGLVLAVLVPLSRLFEWRLEDSRPDMAQVHGEVQAVGFAGLFIIGLALRLMPRFAHTELRFPVLILPIWGLIVAALLTRALVVIWLPDDLHSAGVLAVELSLLFAAGCFASIVWATLLPSRASSEATSWFFLVGAALFLLQALLGTFIALHELRDDTHVFSYLPSASRLYLLLGGFVVAFVGGVSGRALPVMAGLPRSDRAGRIVAVALLIDLLVLAGALFYLEYATYTSGAVEIANLALAGLGIIYGAVVWLTGLFRQAANRLRPASQPHLWLVRSAFGWLALAAALAVYLGVKGLADDALPSFYAVDGLRHALGLGVATILIAGMGLLILPEFANERLDKPDQSRLSYVLLVLLNAAALLRVGSALASPDLDGDVRLAMQSSAGLLAEAALIVLVWSYVRLIRLGNS